jgi:hypothetical protein
MDTPVSSVLCRGGYATAIAELTGMWVVGTKFGYSWKMIQGRVDSTGEDLKGPAFTVPDPKEVRSFVSKKTATVTANRVKEEEAEDDTGEEPIPAFTTMTLAPTPAPAPAPTPAPTPAPAPAVEESEEITEPLPVPKKTVVKKVVKPAARASIHNRHCNILLCRIRQWTRLYLFPRGPMIFVIITWLLLWYPVYLQLPLLYHF